MPTAQKLDFGLLDDIEAGDQITIRFNRTAELGDAMYLLGMIEHGIITSPDMIVLLAMRDSRSWDRAGRQFTVVATDTFDRNWFETRMRRRIELLQVERRRPLVDFDLLRQPGTLRIRLKEACLEDGSREAIQLLLDLEDMQLMVFDREYARHLLEMAYLTESWRDPADRQFVVHWRHVSDFVDEIVERLTPAVELLRD